MKQLQANSVGSGLGSTSREARAGRGSFEVLSPPFYFYYTAFGGIRCLLSISMERTKRRTCMLLLIINISVGWIRTSIIMV